VGAIPSTVQYDGYIKFDVSALSNHISSSTEITSAELYLCSKERISGGSIIVDVRRVKKDFNAGESHGEEASAGEVDWIDAKHNEIEWQRQWQTRKDKLYIVESKQTIDSTGNWYVWHIENPVKFAFDNNTTVRVKLERRRETNAGVWDFYSTENSVSSKRPYLIVSF
jgi:hypothetical protein